MDWKTYIHTDPKILLGKPVIKGTRLSVEFILGLFSEGWFTIVERDRIRQRPLP